ncbi:hypothetical protein LCGC14_1166250 [marine sediment metagenome]|uniref:Uncharacterized protein n=1 Tax=marine sediment metagenome TaxID=412755 RepID=A0A0F9ME53_9ZZZZ
MVCTNCGDAHAEAGTICGWCKEQIRVELGLGGDDVDGLGYLVATDNSPVSPKDLSLSESLQWGEEEGVFADA